MLDKCIKKQEKRDNTGISDDDSLRLMEGEKLLFEIIGDRDESMKEEDGKSGATA